MQSVIDGTAPRESNNLPHLETYYPWTPFFDSFREMMGLPRRMPRDDAEDGGPIRLDPIDPLDSLEEGTGLLGTLYKVMQEALNSKGIEVPLEVTADEGSAEEAAVEAANIA